MDFRMKSLLAVVAVFTTLSFAVLVSGASAQTSYTCPPGVTDTNYCTVNPPAVPGAGVGGGGGVGVTPPTGGGDQQTVGAAGRFRVLLGNNPRRIRSNGNSISILIRGCAITDVVCRYGIRLRAQGRLGTSAKESGTLVGSKSILVLRKRTRSDTTRAKVLLTPRGRKILKKRGSLVVMIVVNGRNAYGQKASQTFRVKLVTRKR